MRLDPLDFVPGQNHRDQAPALEVEPEGYLLRGTQPKDARTRQSNPRITFATASPQASTPAPLRWT